MAQYWCPAPMSDDQEARRKLFDPEGMQAPPPDLLDNYESDSSVDEDEPEKVVAPQQTRQVTWKIPASRAEAEKTAKLEQAKKRKRGQSTTSSTSKAVEITQAVTATSSSEEDEIIADPRLLSPETKCKKEEAEKVHEEDLAQHKAKLAAQARAQSRVPERPRPPAFRAQMKKKAA